MNFRHFFTSFALAFPLGIAAQNDYPLHFDKAQIVTHATRRLNTIAFKSASGTQTFTNPTPTQSYVDLTSKCFFARPGMELTPEFGFTTQWMHGYVYLDCGQDGRFDVSATAAPDLMTFAFYNGKNTLGTAPNQHTVNPPAFTLPALSPGYYRLRFKVDWNSIDPAGALSPHAKTPTGENGIIANGGAIIDTRINLHAETVGVRIVDEQGNVTRSSHPFATPLELHFTPPSGQVLAGIKVRHGYHLDRPALLHDTQQWHEETIPGFLVKDGTYTLPASMVDGDLLITPLYASPAPSFSEGGIYPVNVPEDLTHFDGVTSRLNGLKFVSTSGGTSTLSIDEARRKFVRHDLSRQFQQQVSVVPGDRVQLLPLYTGTSTLHAYLYIDLNQDGQFTPLLDAAGHPVAAGELVAYNFYRHRNSLGESATDDVQPTAFPAFTLSEKLPEGVYRARFVMDKNSIQPAGEWSLAATVHPIVHEGGYVVDFLLNVHAPTARIHLTTRHGNVYGSAASLPDSVLAFRPLSLRAVPVAAGYELETYAIKVGHHLDGPQFVNGNRQWELIERPTAASFSLARTQVVGNIDITARFVPGPSAQYLPFFTEEFEGENGSRPDARYWKRSTREHPVWKRWVSQADEVVYLDEGNLVCRAIPTPESEKQKGETAPMITGSIESRGLVDFQYGKVEGRLKTAPHVGNFPAFWMMPTVSVGKWPQGGEIDIWEQIDTQNTSVHTVHTYWTHNLKKTQNPPHSAFIHNVDMSTYHTYGIEWTPTFIKWTVDGRVVHTYAKSASRTDLEQGQWPFDRKFYLILNQSVGNGTWAAPADETHSYETRFDWVRVYQTREQNPQVSIDAPIASPAADSHYYDLAGRRVSRPAAGLYIHQGKKVWLP